jgi:predicted transcriptional regulator
MFSTTLRLDDDLGRFLREVAEAQAMSVNGWLAELVRREQAMEARRKLAADCAAQAEVAAEPRRRSHRARKAK